jgi:hypothetical protein
MAFSFFVIFPAVVLFGNLLPGIGMQEDVAFISGKLLSSETSSFCLSGSLSDLNYPGSFENTYLLLPGFRDVNLKSLPESAGSASSFQVKFDLNVQPLNDQPGQPFTKDPGGMAGFCHAQICNGLFTGIKKQIHKQ